MLKRGVVVLANRTDLYQQAVEPLGLYLLHPPAKDPPPAKGKGTIVEFTNPITRTWCAGKISDHVPGSLFQPMLQPLDSAEYAPRKDSDLQGTWKGTIRPWYWPFISRRGTLNIAERTPGNFVGELNLPAEKIEKLPIAVIYHPPGVELVIKSGDGMFKGKINATHTKMTGRLIQGKRSIRVTLYRRAGSRNFRRLRCSNSEITA